MTGIVLYDYWRSTASYRVRIALGLLGLDHESVPVDLLKGEHRAAAHLARNPQGLVPAVRIGDETMTQSLAIIEYLHETTPGSTLLPGDAAGRARVRQISHAVAMDIHPVCNLGVVSRVVELAGGGDTTRRAWMQEFIGRGLDAIETLAAGGGAGRFCHGDRPGMADCCLVPQLYNARRWECDTGRWPRLLAIDAACGELAAFRAAHPDAVRPAA